MEEAAVQLTLIMTPVSVLHCISIEAVLTAYSLRPPCVDGLVGGQFFQRTTTQPRCLQSGTGGHRTIDKLDNYR